MQYLMMDLHQRFIGTLNYNAPLTVGDIFKANNAKIYTVVSVDSSRSRDKNIKSLTVIANTAANAANAAATATAALAK